MRLAIVAAIPLLAIGLHGQSDEAALTRHMTYGHVNGRGWKAIAKGERLCFVLGLSEGLVREAPEVFKNNYPANLSNGEVVALIDKFYEDPANVLIAIIDA